jgi:hypothetical protein
MTPVPSFALGPSTRAKPQKSPYQRARNRRACWLRTETETKEGF